MKIDTNGDVRPNVIYRFWFDEAGPLFLGDTAQPFTVTRIQGGRSTVVARTTPPNNIGPRSTPNYRSLVTKSIAAFNGGRSKAFAGQRDDPFFGDIGAIFDLVAIRKGTGNMGGGKDFFAGYAVHTFAVQVSIASLDAKSNTIGVWASVDRQKITTRGGQTRNSGAFVQVNRLGNPLVNEVIIPTGLKDQWNATQPWQESRYRKYYESPLLAAAMNQLYKLDVPEQGRDDLVAVLLTGVPKLNLTGPKLADVLRLNLSITYEEPEPPGRPRGRQSGLAQRATARRRRHRRRRAGGRRLPQGEEGAARRRRQRRRPKAALRIPVRRGSAERLRQYEGRVEPPPGVRPQPGLTPAAARPPNRSTIRCE